MPQNSNRFLDGIIAEALRRELDSVTPPPSDHAWRKICAHLGSARRKRLLFPWGKAAATAAVLLLLVAGVALYRSPWPLSKGGNLAGKDQAEGMPEFLAVPEEQSPGDSRDVKKEDSVACTEEVGPVGVMGAKGPGDSGDNGFIAGSKPDLPPVLGGEYRLEKTIISEDDTVVGCLGGLYGGPQGEILLIYREPPVENPRQLLSEVESAFKISISFSISSPASSEEELAVKDSLGNRGLLLQGETRDTILLVRKGSFSQYELHRLLTEQP